MSKPIAHELAKAQKAISVAAFFEKNRHLLGYANKSQALLTSVKEAVDNALDASEEARILAEIKITLKDLENERYKLIIEDNGPGIVKKQIPPIFGKFLYGSKFEGGKQNRGQQGIGISSVVLYSQLTTGKPTIIISKIDPKHKAHKFILHIDVKTNEPEILESEEIGWDKEHGTKVEFILEGKYIETKQSVPEYVKQTAVVNPHAKIIFIDPKGKKLEYPRVTDKLPKKPTKIKPHPYGVEFGVLKRMLKATKSMILKSFLTNEFDKVGSGAASEILKIANLDPKIMPRLLTPDQMEALLRGMQEAKVQSPSTDCLSPIGAEILKKSVETEYDLEFAHAITRPPSVYRGIPFQIECCTGDTKILLEDGSRIPIKKYVEEKNFLHVMAMDSNLKIRPVKVFAVHKFKNKHRLLKFTTRTGRTLTLTNNNQVPIIKNGEIHWIEAKNVTAGEYIAVPRRYEFNTNTPNILQLLNPKHVKVHNAELIRRIARQLQNKLGSHKYIAELLNIKYDYYKGFIKKIPTRPTLQEVRDMLALLGKPELQSKITKIAYVDNRFYNPIPVDIPVINEDLLYILGLLQSDGYISKQSIVFVNTDQYLHKLFSEKFKDIFGITIKHYKKNESYISNKTTYHILTALISKISSLPDDLVLSWLKGFVDGDGWVACRNGRIDSIGIATAKRELAELVQTLLLRFEINSKIERQKPTRCVGYIGDRPVRTLKDQYNIVTRSFDAFSKFHSLINFRQQKRRKLLEKGILRKRYACMRSDVIPAGTLLRDFRSQNNLFQYEFGLSDQSIRQAELSHKSLTRLHLQSLFLDKKRFYLGEAFRKLLTLTFSDVLWDKIISIEEMPNEEFVYDLTTEASNFVANNVIMHNCAIGYGGELEKEGSVKVARFANRVPLLYQQGACAISKAVQKMNWKPYGLSQSGSSLPTGPAIIVVHMASVWVPFTSEGKEAIASYPGIIKQMKLALQECGRHLQLYVSRKMRAQAEKEREETFKKYAGELAKAISKLTDKDEKGIYDKLIKIAEKNLNDIGVKVEKKEEK